MRRHPWSLVIGVWVLALVVGVVGLTLGRLPLGLDRVGAALLGAGSPSETFVVVDLRLPRVLCALLVGALLAWSGALFQGVFRNPLVSPDFIGIEAGASVAAVTAVVMGAPWALVPVVAFSGAATTALAVYALSWKGHLSGTRLILVGVGANALLQALIQAVLIGAGTHQAAQAYQWMVGSLYSTNLAEAALLAGVGVVLVPLGLALVPAVRVLQVGDLGAKSLGLAVEPVRLAVLAVACALAAVAVALVGPIGFVALAVPHLARMLAGPLSKAVFVLSGGLGALLLVVVDLAGQHLIPLGLPAGVLAAALGGPYFLFLLSRRTVEAP